MSGVAIPVLLFLSCVGCACNNQASKTPTGQNFEETTSKPATSPGGDTSKTVPGPRPKFIGDKKTSGPVVVFVHGLMGDGDSTWRNSNTNAYWPELVLNDPAFSGFTILSYEYNSSLFKGVLTVDQLSRHLRNFLESEQLRDRQFIFVCHSLGGLVARSAILRDESLAKNTQFIYLVSTPLAGSELATYGPFASRNPQIGNLMITDAHDWADELHDQWIENRRTREIPTYTAYETLDTSYFGISVRVVTKESADRGANRGAYPIEGDHITICKPANVEAEIYRNFRNAHLATTPNLCTAGVKRWPDYETCKEQILEFATAEDVQKRHQNAKHANDITLTIENVSHVNVGIVLCNAPAYFRDISKMGSPATGLPVIPYGRESKKVFSRIEDPTGHFLIFVRYRSKDGTIVDKPLGLHYLFDTQDPYIKITRTIGEDVPVRVTIQHSTPEPSN